MASFGLTRIEIERVMELETGRPSKNRKVIKFYFDWKTDTNEIIEHCVVVNYDDLRRAYTLAGD